MGHYYNFKHFFSIFSVWRHEELVTSGVGAHAQSRPYTGQWFASLPVGRTWVGVLHQHPVLTELWYVI